MRKTHRARGERREEYVMIKVSFSLGWWRPSLVCVGERKKGWMGLGQGGRSPHLGQSNRG